MLFSIFIVPDYDAVKRLGIEDPLKFIKQRYKSHDLLMLDSCCFGPGVISEVEGCVQEEVQRMEKWVDIMVGNKAFILHTVYIWLELMFFVLSAIVAYSLFK